MQDYYFGVLSCKAMKWRGFSERPIHPKHLFDKQRSEYVHGLLGENIAFLDIGSGVGSECMMAAEKGAQLSVGLEGNRESIETAHNRCRQKQHDVSFIQIDLEQGILPFKSGSFDLINFSNVLEHLFNRNAVLTEIKRVKRDTGIVVISIPNSETSWKRKLKAVGLDSRDDPDHKVEYSRESLVDELGLAGLKLHSDLMPIIPSWPWNGLMAMSSIVSPSFYRRVQQYKYRYVIDHPEDSIGWVFTAR